MCFIEFVGYTCGHTSLPVLRACPLTTASHTFPTCPRRGDKTFFAGEMCSACQKIVHSRATQIEEYEHRFMHERGVCGCETVFPYLIRPRVIGSCSRGDPEGGGAYGEGGLGDGEENIHIGFEEHGGTDPANTTSETQLPPLLCEATDAGGRAVVSVRLPSLYAAEWVADHRARHDAGLCHCRADFRTYQQTIHDAEAEAIGIEKDSGSHRPVRRVLSMSAMPQEEEAHICRGLFLQRSSSHEDFSYFISEDGGDNQGDDIYKRQGEFISDGATLVTPANAMWDANTAVSHTPTPPYLGKAVRYAGAVFAEVPDYLQLTGPFLVRPSPYAQDCDQTVVFDGIFDVGGEMKERDEGKDGHAKEDASAQKEGQNWSPLALLPPSEVAPTLSPTQSRAQVTANMKQHHVRQARKKDPLVGFPIGAGPEGVSHSIPWRNRPPCWRRS